MLKYNPNRLKEGSYKYLGAQSKGYQDGDLPPLSVADTDFFLPTSLTEPLSEFMKHYTHGYNAITDDYKEALRNWLRTQHNFDINPKWLCVSTGVIPAIANALYAFTEKNDAVCIMSPVYHMFYKVIDRLERKTVINPLILNEDLSYDIDFNLLEKQFISENVKVMLFCSPHNPIGKVWSKEDLITLSNLCEKHDVLVIADEIHFDLIMPGHTHIVYPSLSDVALNHTILCTAASKTFNLAGLKTSNIIIPNPHLKQKYIQTYEKMALGIDSPNTVGLYATQVAYESGQPYLEEFLCLIEKNYQTMKQELSENIPIIKLSPLEGTYLLWLDFRELGLSQVQLISFLEEVGLYLSNGLDFGSNGEGFMRMNIALAHEFIPIIIEKLKTMHERIQKMKKITLNDGNAIDIVGSGTNTFGKENHQYNAPINMDTTEIENAIDLGYRHFDTAISYRNEAVLAKAWKKSGLKREAFFFTSKLPGRSPYIDTKEDVIKAIESSLSALETDYIDLYLIHHPWEDDLKMLEVWRVLEKAVKIGKIRSIGVSNFNEKQLQTLYDQAIIKPAVNQIESHPGKWQHDLIKFTQSLNIQVVAWGPLSNVSEKEQDILKKIAKVYGKTWAQVILRYQVEQNVIVIPKSHNRLRQQQNLDIFNFELSDEDKAMIEQL